MKVNNIEDFNKSISNNPGIPIEVLIDIKSRIGDWTTSGGSLDDPYIKQQFRYIENVIKIYGK